MPQVAAAWSSSGVVNPIVNFTDFDQDIFDATSRSGPSCPAIITGITNYIDAALADPATHQSDVTVIEGIFGPTGNYFDFMFYIADIFTLGVQYGSRGPVCNWLMSLQGTTVQQQL